MGLKLFSDKLRRDGINSLYNISNSKNRTLAIKDFQLAQIIWPPLFFDKSFQIFFSFSELNKIKLRAAVFIYPNDNATTDDINSLISELRNINGVKDVKFISHQDALKIYKDKNKDSPALLELIKPELLPESIEVYLNDFTIRNQIENVAKSKSFILEVIQVP